MCVIKVISEDTKELQAHFKGPLGEGLEGGSVDVSGGLSSQQELVSGVGGGGDRQRRKKGTHTDLPVWDSDNADSQLCHEFAGWLTPSR